nr:MBOAT family protein [Candidatus Magasanikbacteria bacterium]
MVFSSLIFLFGFFPLFFAAYYATPARFRNFIALAGSLGFYVWGAPTFAVVLLASCIVDYVLSQFIAKTEHKPKQKILLVGSLVLNLGLLLYFKYANFFVGEFNSLLQSFGAHPAAWTKVVLPIGISFFTFHKISYLVDVYRGTAKPARSLIEFLLYILIFPQLIAGPIIRYHDVEDQLSKRPLSLTEIGYGLRRFCFGLGKKVLIANPLGAVADSIFALSPLTLEPSFAWLGILCYTFQLFFDFSGYSDMAIGLGRMLGFKWMENFNHPYIAQNITDFWRRWHISLSRFMREYVYIPLGGNRVAVWRAYLNLIIVFALSGIWHGANWTFLVWGLYHGLFIVLDKAGLVRLTERLPKIFNAIITFVLVMIGWVFFRSDTIGQAVQFIGAMLGLAQTPPPGTIFLADVIGLRTWISFVLAFIFSFLPLFSSWEKIEAWVKEHMNHPVLLV